MRIQFLFAVLIGITGMSAAAPVRIRADQPVGPQVEYWGWDLKGNPRLMAAPARANGFFSDGAANLLRIPIYANAHSSDGSVDASAYTAMLASIRNARANNPQLQIFASIKLLGADTFPAWLAGKKRGQIFADTVAAPEPRKYATLLASYVKFLRDANIVIDYLGINNETEGAVPAAVYIETWRALQAELAALPPEYRAFQYVGPDAYSLGDSVAFMKRIARSATGAASVDIAGSHYYFGTREAPTRAGWRQLAKAAGDRPLWFTEAHINQGSDPVAELRHGLAMIFSANIGGASGFVWWDPVAASDGLQFSVERALMRTMLGARPIETSPAFKEQDADATAPLYQAYRQGDTIHLWIVNPGRTDAVRVVMLRGATVSRVTGATFWTGSAQGTNPEQSMLASKVSSEPTQLTITGIPAGGAGVISFTIAPQAGTP